jgi:hypothetical protein
MHNQLVTQAAHKLADDWIATQKAWQEEVQNDPEIGGPNLDSMKSTVAKALDKYGDQKAREALYLTGAGNNPALIRMMYRMAKDLTESGSMISGGPASTPPPRGPAAMYPHLPSGAGA